VKYSLKKGGPPSKGKYELNTDSEEYREGKYEKRTYKRSEKIRKP